MNTYTMKEVYYMNYIYNNEIYRKIHSTPNNMKFLGKKKSDADYIFYSDQDGDSLIENIHQKSVDAC